jgi:hypothetical protein
MNITRFKKRAKNCGICMNEVEFQGKTDSCSHIFCMDCIKEWAKVIASQIENTCPLCKIRFTTITKVPHRVAYAAKCRKEETVFVSNKSQSVLLANDNFNSFIENAQRLIQAEYETLLRRL